jgi:hypothetical protein
MAGGSRILLDHPRQLAAVRLKVKPWPGSCRDAGSRCRPVIALGGGPAGEERGREAGAEHGDARAGNEHQGHAMEVGRLGAGRQVGVAELGGHGQPAGDGVAGDLGRRAGRPATATRSV